MASLDPWVAALLQGQAAWDAANNPCASNWAIAGHSALALFSLSGGIDPEDDAVAEELASSGADDAEGQALQTALDEGRVGPGAPANHLNGAIAEELGWQEALADGQIGIEGPSALTSQGPDYITYDTESREINVWDAKWRSSGNFPSGIPTATLAAWEPYIAAAVNGYSGPDAAAIADAFANGSVRGRIFGYSPS